MMGRIVHYPNVVPWCTAPTRYQARPWTEFFVEPQGGQREKYWGLIDTGADDLLLDEDAAIIAGLNLTAMALVEITYASGASVWLPKTEIDITAFGRRVRVPAVFGIKGEPLIGRNALEKLITFGVDDTGWMYD